jgi:hypothetical protein
MISIIEIKVVHEDHNKIIKMKKEKDGKLQAVQLECLGDKIFRTVTTTPARRRSLTCGSILSVQILLKRALHSYSAQ